MIVLERPACATCDTTLSVRVYYKLIDGQVVKYRNGDTIDHNNFHEFSLCPRCDR